jgi:hypothetical protein
MRQVRRGPDHSDEAEESQLRHSGPGLCRRLEGALDQASEEVLVHQADLLDVVGRARERVGV